MSTRGLSDSILSSGDGSISFGLNHHGLICHLSQWVGPFITPSLPVTRMSLVLPLTECPALPHSTGVDSETRMLKVSTTRAASPKKCTPTALKKPWWCLLFAVWSHWMEEAVSRMMFWFSFWTWRVIHTIPIKKKKKKFSNTSNSPHWAPSVMKIIQQKSTESSIFNQAANQFEVIHSHLTHRDTLKLVMRTVNLEWCISPSDGMKCC